MLSKSTLCHRLVLSIVCLIGLSLIMGCATKRDSALQQDSAELLKARGAGDFAMTLDAAEASFEKRVNRADLEAAIARWELATTLETPDFSEDERRDAIAGIYEKLTRAYYFLADSHIAMTGDDESANHPEMMLVYEKGVTAAERALALRDPAFVAKINAGESWQNNVANADPAAIPALYWYATNLGKWALLEGIATILARKDDIKATMDFIIEKDPEFFHGAAYRYFGVYWTKLPFGKKPDESEAAFNRTLEISPNYFASHVLLAENLATLNNNRELFDKHLTYVLETPLDVVPELEPENTFERKKAERLKKRGDRLFR
ncbi:MAG: TRAP transporter TatT component family protein [Bradymonadaceae bacterium]